MKRLAELMNMDGRVALITGGAGHIGMAIAEALAELGCDICLVDRPEVPSSDFAERLSVNWGHRVESLAIDLEDENARSTIPGSVADRFGRLDVLVNCAGFVGTSKLKGWGVPLEEQTVDTWRRVIEVNMTSVFQLCQILAPLLRAGHGGSIINVSSIYGVVGPNLSLYSGTKMGNSAAYATSKGGVVQLTRWLSTVLAPQIRVNCISPGGVYRNQAEEFVARYVERTPLGRMGVEDDFKGAVAYFASDLSAYVTGENLMVDGGWTKW
ncbi:MAG: SDR family oxidoreductase [Sulfuritalea sp.]|nr:SDR family oxidoreductase [Sulfuritalea sp.]